MVRPQVSSGLVGPDVFPAPPPGHQGRAVWKPTKQALGPVALSLFSVSQSAAALDRNFRIHRHDCQPVDLFNMPHQCVKAQLSDIAAQARLGWAATTREHLLGVGDIDRAVLQQALSHRNAEECRILKHSMSLSSWANDKLCEAGFVASPRCELCGHENQTTMHLLHHCPALEMARKQAKEQHIPDVNLDDLPPPLRLGIPLAMACTSENTFWGTEWVNCKLLPSLWGALIEGTICTSPCKIA